MEQITLLEVNKPEKVQQAINECLDFKNEGHPVVDKTSLGLGNVDNTPDLEKPTSNPQKYYIETQITAAKNVVNTYTDNKVEDERQRAVATEMELSARMSAQEGLGGALTAHNFGKAIPSQAELTQYALSQIPSISDPLEIWNSTHVTNLFDNAVWQLNNTQNTNPQIFEWVNIGSAQVAQATNETLGTVKGNAKIRVLADGSLDTDAESIGAATTAQVLGVVSDAKEALRNAKSANSKSTEALGNMDFAISVAMSAEEKSEAANDTATEAKNQSTTADTKASTALSEAQNAIQKVAQVEALAVLMSADKDTIIAAVNQLSQQVGEGQGTTVLQNGVAVGTYNADEVQGFIGALVEDIISSKFRAIEKRIKNLENLI